MAVIPRYGRQMGAPGPVGYNPGTGPLWDAGLKTLADMTGDAAGAVAEKRRRIQRASETADVIGRSAEFSLTMDRIGQEAQKLATPEERDKYFQTETESLRARLLDAPNLSMEAATDLNNTITGQFTRHQQGFMQAQERRELQNIADKMEYGYQAAVRAGDAALAQKMLDDGVTNEIISEATRDQRLAGFEIDSRLNAIRKQMDILDQANVDDATKINGLAGLQTQLEDVREGELSDDQRTLATRLLEWARADSQAVGVARVKAQKEFVAATGRTVYADMTEYETSGGKSGKDYSIAQLGELFINDALDRGTYDALVKIKTGESHPDPWSTFSAEELITEVESGQKTAEEAMVRQIDLAPNLTADQRAKFNTDLAKARSAWRGRVRRSGERAIDEVLNPSNMLVSLPIPQSVSAVAKTHYWNAVRELEEKRELLDEGKLLSLAVNLATDALGEYRIDRSKFSAKYGYKDVRPGGTPSAVTQSRLRITTDEEYENLPEGAEFIGPDERARRKP